jgi:hypothetical protein
MRCCRNELRGLSNFMKPRLQQEFGNTWVPYFQPNNEPRMSVRKRRVIFFVCLAAIFALPAFGQGRCFKWMRQHKRSARLPVTGLLTSVPPMVRQPTPNSLYRILPSIGAGNPLVAEHNLIRRVDATTHTITKSQELAVEVF